MRVIFFGNHDVGVAALGALSQFVDVVGVVAHPLDPEDGIRYSSLYDFSKEIGLEVLRGAGKDPHVSEFVRRLSPDLIWVTDYRYLIPTEFSSICKFGAVNLHPSLLPNYRGRAAVNWAILNGETEIGLTAHFIDSGVDTGDIISQRSFFLDDSADVGDALTTLLPLYYEITKEVIFYFAAGNVPRKKQPKTRSYIYPARKAEDGKINWSRSAREILNLVRAVASPYPGAFCEIGPDKLFVWKANLIEINNFPTQQPGIVISYSNCDLPIIQCGKGFLEIREWTTESGNKLKLNIGDELR